MQNFLKKVIIAVYMVYLSKLMTSILAKKNDDINVQSKGRAWCKR